MSWPELLARPATDVVADIHCVTKWSKFDTTWKGVRLRELIELAGPRPDATHVVMHAEHGYTANVPSRPGRPLARATLFMRRRRSARGGLVDGPRPAREPVSKQ